MSSAVLPLMEDRLQFFVEGTPIPKGSHRAFVNWRVRVKCEACGNRGRGAFAVITDDNEGNPETGRMGSKEWQKVVSGVAFVTKGHNAPIEGPVMVEYRFFLPRPKSAPKRVIVPTTKPDLGKLVRVIEDAMTKAGVYKDDSQIVNSSEIKRFAGGWGDPLGPAGEPRVDVIVKRLV